MASAASSSSGNRCDGTNEQLVRTQTEGKTSGSLSTNGPFLFIWLPSEETCSVLMLAVGPAGDDGTYNEPLLHLLFRDRKHSVGAVVSSSFFFPQTLRAFSYAGPDEIWFLEDVCGLTDVWFRSKLKPQPFSCQRDGSFPKFSNSHECKNATAACRAAVWSPATQTGSICRSFNTSALLKKN